MPDDAPVEVAMRGWSSEDLGLLERLLGDPAMTRHLGGPETPEQLRKRHERYLAAADSADTLIFAVVVGPDREAAGSVVAWEHEWRGTCNEWVIDSATTSPPPS